MTLLDGFKLNGSNSADAAVSKKNGGDASWGGRMDQGNSELDDRSLLAERYQAACKARDERRFDDVDILLSGFDEAVANLVHVDRHGNSIVNAQNSLVIVSHCFSEQMIPAFEAIATEAASVGFEIILVDNGNDRLLDLAKGAFASFSYIRAPFQTGASGGRNLGSRFAVGETLIFLDDDGIIEPGCVSALLKCLTETTAVAVRGRVEPLTDGTTKPFHYDLGEVRIPSFINCEGVSAWKRSTFCEFGGFDVGLATHEGLELCARMWRFFGPLAFIYEPTAILKHDFAIDHTKIKTKTRRALLNREFVSHKNPAALDLVIKTRDVVLSPREFYLAHQGIRPPPPPASLNVTVLTTARNSVEFLQDYTESWRRQIPSGSQIVFVDDGSADGTYERIRELWRDDDRLVALRRPQNGRGAALNAALEAAENEICLIADVDDISIPERIRTTCQAFEREPDLDYLSFLLFNEADLFRAPRRQAPILIDMGVECLFGMPAPFPGFAFKKSRFTVPFDESLRGGVDCDWLRKNLVDRKINGRLLQQPMVYYRRHPGQITHMHNPVQKVVRKELIYQEFEQIGVALSDRERQLIDILIDVRKADSDDKNDLVAWVIKVLKANENSRRHNQYILATVLLDALHGVAVVPTKNSVAAEARFNELRFRAEDYIRNRQFKEARKILKQALRIRSDLATRRRLLSANKFGVVRMLFRSKPYVGETAR